MFGLGFSEMVVVGIVLLVVVGPRELPKLLRTVGRGITKLKAMSAELRDQSGIDDIIEDENLREDLNAIRSLSRGNVVNSLMRESRTKPRPAPRPAPLPAVELSEPEGEPPDPAVEYPAIGCDDYGALADDALPQKMHLHHEADVGAPANGEGDANAGGDADGEGEDDADGEGEADANAEGGADADAGSAAGGDDEAADATADDEDVTAGEDAVADSGPRNRAEAS